MKTFQQFIIEATARRSPRKPGESIQDYVKRTKGITDHPDLSADDEVRKSGKTKNVSSKDAGFGSQSNTQTPPKGTQTPPRGTQTPPKSSSSLVSSTTKQAAKSTGKSILRRLGKVVGPASAALDVADERSKGSGWLRSLAKGATVAAGGALGGAAGSAAGPVGTIAGGIGGAEAASKAFDVAAGANAKERKGIATANRKTQAGGAIKGVGGKTSFDTKKNTITSGGKTAQLGKTSVVTNPKTGKQEVGNLAYKNGQAVYKRSDTKSLAQTSSNPLERIGRTINPNAYKQSDAANAAKKLNQARQSDVARNKALGVKLPPGK